MRYNKNLKIILLASVSISCILVISTVPISYEHAFISSSIPSAYESIPSAPSKINIIFSDPVDIKYSSIKVVDPNGKQVQNNDLHYTNSDHTGLEVTLQSGLPNGIYTVSTKVLDATDGHVTTPGIVFGVNSKVPQNLAQPSSNILNEISIPESIARFPTLVAQVIVVGVASATLWLWKPISDISWLRPFIAESRVLIDKRMMKWALIGSILLVASDFGMVAAEAFAIGGGLGDAFSTKFGSMMIARIIISAVLLGVSAAIYLGTRKGKQVARSSVWILFGMGIVTLLTTSLVGHGAATGQAYALLLDFVHNIVASLWIGGVFYLAFVVSPILKQLKNKETHLSLISIMIPRFSILVVASLGVVAITGPFLLYVLENNLSLTLVSTYGKILIIKLLLATALLSTGAYTQLVIHKKISNLLKAAVKNNRTLTVSSESVSDHITFHRVEALIGIALLASVAVLTNSGTPGNEFPIQQSEIPNVFAMTPLGNVHNNIFTDTKTADGNNVVMTLSPFGLGIDNFTVTFLDPSMKQLDMKSAELVPTQTDKGISLQNVEMQKTGNGSFTADVPFSIGGNWEIGVNGFQSQANSTEFATTYDLYLKPTLNQLSFNITEYRMPQNTSLPLYPVYDKSREVVWVGDSAIGSGRIFSFDLNSHKYTEHKLSGINVVTWLALDSHDTIWYIDPITKTLGHYNPDNNSDKQYTIPSKGIISGMTLDKMSQVWLIIANDDKLLKFNPQTGSFVTIPLPVGSEPLGITTASDSGKIWIAESGTGKIAEVDPTNGDIIQHNPRINATQADLTAILENPKNDQVYVTEHEGHGLLVLDSLINMFKSYPLDPNTSNLPFGMTLDDNGYLWIAQHTYDKIAVVDPSTGQYTQIDIPSKNSFTQWLVATDKGIVIAEQRAHALGLVTSRLNTIGSVQNAGNLAAPNIPVSYLNYTGFVTPLIAVFVVTSSFFYAKTTTDLTNSVRDVKRYGSYHASSHSPIIPQNILYDKKDDL
jgi:copper transport protein